MKVIRLEIVLGAGTTIRIGVTIPRRTMSGTDFPPLLWISRPLDEILKGGIPEELKALGREWTDPSMQNATRGKARDHRESEIPTTTPLPSRLTHSGTIPLMSTRPLRTTLTHSKAEVRTVAITTALRPSPHHCAVLSQSSPLIKELLLRYPQIRWPLSWAQYRDQGG
jgi:hypothetical protein